jgi:polysaccharide pyruvyl transferase WcaK-like protein
MAIHSMITQIDGSSVTMAGTEKIPPEANRLGELPSSVAITGRLKVLFVGDNRTNVNWGRGASIALAQLLSGAFEITGRIGGDFFELSTAEAGYVGTLMPAKFYWLFRYLLLRRGRRPFGWYIRLERLCGARDFIAQDPAVSVENLLTHKHRQPVLARIYDQAAEADLLVLDGDGDIIFSTPPRRQTLFLLAMMELGIRLKKPVFLVNSMISDCPLTGRNSATFASARRLFAQCTAVSMRDPESLAYVQKEMPETNATFIPDSLFSWFSLYSSGASPLPLNGDFLLPHPEKDGYWGKLDFSQPYICIGGGALAASQPDRSVECYARLVDAIRQLGYSVYLTENDFPDSFLQRVAREKNVGIVPVDAPILLCGAVLAHARLFISGRYHPSIFASLGGTPCIFLGSHAHKMGSLSQVLEYVDNVQLTAFPGDDDIAEIVSRARKYLDQGETLRAKIRQVAKRRCDEAAGLPTFLQRHMKG